MRPGGHLCFFASDCGLELLRDLLDRKPSVLKTDLRIGKEMIFWNSRLNDPSFLLRPDIQGGQQSDFLPEEEHKD